MEIPNPLPALRLAALTLCLSLCGCVTSTTAGMSNAYPTGWPQLKTTPDPEAGIVGEYSNLGEATINPTERPSLHSAYLNDFFLLPIHAQSGARIRITHPAPGVLNIEGFVGTTVIGPRELRQAAGDYTVADGLVWLEPTASTRAELAGKIRQSDRIGLTQSTDGALVCEWQHDSNAAALWMVPVKGRQLYWLRFPPK